MTMEADELEVLIACREAEIRQARCFLLAEAVGVPPHEVFYAWALRGYSQSGYIGDLQWRYFFHGQECEIRNTRDCRFVRLDFGPEKVDTLTAWGVLQFLMTSTHPWPEFTELKVRFARLRRRGRVFRRFPKIRKSVGSTRKSGMLRGRRSIPVELVAQSTTIGEDGIARICYPADTPERVAWMRGGGTPANSQNDGVEDGGP